MNAARERLGNANDEANTQPPAHRPRHSQPAKDSRVGPPAIRLSGNAATGPAETTARAEEVIKDPGSGEPLPAQSRTALEKSLGQDLQPVRVHKDERANAAADSLGARAFTYGTHIFLGSREQPSDMRLMAHEIAHVIQQKSTPNIQMSKSATSAAGLEREADDVAALAERGQQTSVRGRTGGARVQGSFWSSVKSAASSVGSALAGGAKAVGSAVVGGVKAIGSGISSAVGAIGSALGSAWSAATHALGSAASWMWHGLQTLGSGLLNWLSKASSAVWSAIKWFGNKAWDAIKWLGAFLWEKLSLLGTLAWSFISNFPVRAWRLVVHYWHGITGFLGWIWSGLKAAGGWVWDAIVGVFSWLGSGLKGAWDWLKEGVLQGAAWAWDFIQDPSLDKLWHGFLGMLSWLGRGVVGLVKWGWRGIVAAALWAWKGIKGLGAWLWEGVLSGLKWCGELILYLFELYGGGEALQLLWGLIFRLRPLTSAEKSASQEVHAAGQIPYWQVRVDDNSVLIRIGTTLSSWFSTKVSPGAITTMHVIHLPAGGVGLDVVVHELTHVAQYEKVGAVYMPQALHAQGTVQGYNYGDLAAAITAGKHFSDFNREQQAQICEDYYSALHNQPTEYGGTTATLQPFIDEMRKGKF